MTLSTKYTRTGVYTAVLLLSALLLAPLSVQAQSITTFWMIQYEGSLKVGATVGVSGQAEQFPAAISVSWGDGSSSSIRVAKTGEWGRGLSRTYANCGVKSLSASVTFNDGATASRSKDFTVFCPPAQEPEGGPLTCDIQIAPGTFFLPSRPGLLPRK